MQALSGPADQSSSRGAASVHVKQHALEEHTPRIQGPFPITSAEGPAESLLTLAQSSDTAAGLCTLRYASMTPLTKIDFPLPQQAQQQPCCMQFCLQDKHAWQNLILVYSLALDGFGSWSHPQA